jgi:hypothetical protein
MSDWFVIKLAPGPGNSEKWPRGDIYVGLATGDALAYKSYMVLSTGLNYAERFRWEDNQGDYLIDSQGWYLGYDGPSGCLKEHYKGLASRWMPIQDGNTWHLVDTGSKRIVSWDPNQRWPLASTTTFLQEFDAGDKYSLGVELLASSAPQQAVAAG